MQVQSPENNRSHSVTVDPDHAYQAGEFVPLNPVGHSHAIQTRNSVRDFLTVLALSCHAIFEGLAVGLEKDSEAVWTLFAGFVLDFFFDCHSFTINNSPYQKYTQGQCVSTFF